MDCRTRLLLVSVLSSLAVGCTPARIVTPTSTGEGKEVSSILVYRTIDLNAGGISLIFGADETDYFTLKSDEYAELQLQPGTYQFFVRSNQADKPFVLEEVLNPGDHKCLRAYANPHNYWKALTLVGYYFGNTFKIEEVECPSHYKLVPYRRIEVQHHGN
jgi:hypothetical protein